MGAINGTSLLLYSDGTVIAMQKGMSISVDTDLPDATNKESAGWAQHIQGMLNAKIDFNSLFACSVTGGMDATHLMEYITSRKNLLVSILGLSFPIVAEVSLSSLSFDAPQEGAMTLSGSLKVNGQLFCLRGTMAQMISNLAAGNTYDTFTLSGTAVSSAINIAGAATSTSNASAITTGSTYKLVTFLTKVSGELPSCAIVDPGVGDKSNVVALTEGLNIISLIATDSGDYSLVFSNSAAASWSASSVYLFKI